MACVFTSGVIGKGPTLTLVMWMFRTPIMGEGEHVDYYCKDIVKDTILISIYA